MKNILSYQTKPLNNPLKSAQRAISEDAPKLKELLSSETKKVFDTIINEDYDPFKKEGEFIQISVEEFANTRVAKFQREHNAKKQRSNYNSNGGVKNFLQKTPLRLYVEELEENIIPDTMHTSAYALYAALEKNPNGKVWVEQRTVRTLEEAVQIFDAWNASGITPANKEVSIISAYNLKTLSAVAVVHVMLEVGRKFQTFQKWHTAPFNEMSKFSKTVARGKFEKAIKADPLYKNLLEVLEDKGVDCDEQWPIIRKMAVVKACRVIDSIDLWKHDKKDSVQLIEGLTDLFINVSVMSVKPKPLDTFIDWINEFTKHEQHTQQSDKRFGSIENKNYFITQENFCYSGNRVAQKDAQSIAYLLLYSFVKSGVYKDEFGSQGCKGLGGDIREMMRLRVDPNGEWRYGDNPNSVAKSEVRV